MDGFIELDKDLKQTDIDLCDLYFKAIKRLLNTDDPKYTNGFRRYLELLRTEANANCEFYENPDDPDNTLATLFKENLFYRIAYIYRNSTLYSSTVAFHFQNVLQLNPAILEKLLQKRKIRICSLGCGPASDVVAVVKILQSAAEKRAVKLDIRVAVVDADLSWKNTCLGVLRSIPMLDKAVLKVNFIQADLSQFFTLETVDAIRNADVVTLMKFSSEFVRGYLDCKYTISEISEIMNPGSLLFFLDRPNSVVMRSCGGISGNIQNFELIYEEIYGFFNLHPAAIEINYHLYEELFGANVCNTCFKAFCRVWIRLECERNLVESPVCLRTDSSESPRFAENCGNSTATSPTGYGPKFESSLIYQKMGPEYRSLEKCMLPSWLKTECGNLLGDPLIKLKGVDCLESAALKSEVGNLLASSPLRLECGDSWATSSFKTECGDSWATSSFKTECGDSRATSSVKTECGNTLESVPVSVRSEPESRLMISPRDRFRNKREKFDLLDFFRQRPYKAWLHLFCTKMEGFGWNSRRLQIYSQSYENMWDDLYINLQEIMKRMADVQEELIVHTQRQSGVIGESIWKKFMISKRELAFVKRQIYSEIVINLRGILKSRFPIHKH